MTMLFPEQPVLGIPLSDGALPVIVSFVSSSSRSSNSRLFPFVRFPDGDIRIMITQVLLATQPSWVPNSRNFLCSVSRLLYSGPLPSSDLFNHVCDLCVLSYPDEGFSVLLCDVNSLLSICVCVAAALASVHHMWSFAKASCLG